MLKQSQLSPVGFSSPDGFLIPEGSKNFDKYSHVTVATVSDILDARFQKSFNIVLLTIHGSHLYGFETETSDVDVYVVVDFADSDVNKKFTKQFIVEHGGVNFDVNVVGWKRWVELLNKGRHQACEAFFSPFAYVHSNYAAYCEGYVLPSSVLIESFVSVIKSFTFAGFNCPKNVAFTGFVEPGDNVRNVKKLRHAVRLALHVKMLYETGVFTPHVGVVGFPDFDTINIVDYVVLINETASVEVFH